MCVVLQQQTLAKPVSFSGIGLHSGNKVSMTLLPAPASTGIIFRRVDLESRFEVPAQVKYVADTSRSTTIAKGKVKVQTIEHVLASLAGFGITNAIIEVDANEPPIADGSSRRFCRMIDEAGIEPQREEVDPITITDAIEYMNGETVMSALPYDGFKISFTSSSQTKSI